MRFRAQTEAPEQFRAEFDPAPAERADAAQAEHGVPRGNLGVHRRAVGLAPGQQTMRPEEEGSVQPGEAPSRREAVVRGEARRVFLGVRGEGTRPAGAPDPAAGVHLNPDFEEPAADFPLPAQEEAVVLGTRPGDDSLRAAVLGEHPAPPGGEQAGAEGGTGDLGAHAGLRQAGAEGGAGARGEGGVRNRAAGPGMDDAAEGVRSVGHGGGAADDLDRLEEERVEETPARPRPPLAGDAGAVEQEHRPAAGEAAERGDPGVEVAAARAAGDRLEHIGEAGRLPGADRLPGDHRGGGAGSGVGVGNGAGGDRDALHDGERGDADLHHRRVEGGDEDRRGVAVARQHHQHRERRRRVGLPGEPAVRAGGHRAGGAEDLHDGPDDRLAAAFERDPALEGAGGRRQPEEPEEPTEEHAGANRSRGAAGHRPSASETHAARTARFRPVRWFPVRWFPVPCRPGAPGRFRPRQRRFGCITESAGAPAPGRRRAPRRRGR